MGKCKKCPAGSVTAVANQAACASCPAGTIATDEGSTLCQQCAEDTYQNATGQVSCTPCPINTTASLGSLHCTICTPPETYINSVFSIAGIKPCDILKIHYTHKDKSDRLVEPQTESPTPVSDNAQGILFGEDEETWVYKGKDTCIGKGNPDGVCTSRVCASGDGKHYGTARHQAAKLYAAIYHHGGTWCVNPVDVVPPGGLLQKRKKTNLKSSKQQDEV